MMAKSATRFLQDRFILPGRLLLDRYNNNDCEQKEGTKR